jgi:hypothetical protein
MHTVISADFNCTHVTIGSDIQLQEDDNITILANSLQNIVCTNTTPEIFDISYNFDPSNSVVRRTRVYYIPLHMHEFKFFLNSSATLTIGGIHSTRHNDANYTLVINIQVVPGT